MTYIFKNNGSDQKLIDKSIRDSKKKERERERDGH